MASITPEFNEIRLVESLGYFYRYAKKELEGGGYQYQWQHWSIGYQNYLVGERMKKIFSGLSTLQMVNYQRFIDGPSIRCPWAKQKENIMVDLVLKKRTIQLCEDSITPSDCEFINA